MFVAIRKVAEDSSSALDQTVDGLLVIDRFAPISALRRIAMCLSSVSTQVATNDVDPAALRHSPTIFVHNLGSRLRCVKCAEVGIHPG
jgi:hypothetical protein